jgi:hypothetical protein
VRGQQPVETLPGWLGNANDINRREKGSANRKQLLQSGNETRSSDFNERLRFPLCSGGHGSCRDNRYARQIPRVGILTAQNLPSSETRQCFVGKHVFPSLWSCFCPGRSMLIPVLFMGVRRWELAPVRRCEPERPLRPATVPAAEERTSEQLGISFI